MNVPLASKELNSMSIIKKYYFYDKLIKWLELSNTANYPVLVWVFEDMKLHAVHPFGWEDPLHLEDAKEC